MSFNLTDFIGGSVGSAVKDIVSAFKVDPTVALEKQAEITEIQLQLQGKIIDQVNSQIEVNKAEASNANLFVSGWRPFIGWICGTALASEFIIGPLFSWITTLAGHPVAWPVFNNGDLMTILLGMLGLGGMRTYEKVAGAPGTSGLK